MYASAVAPKQKKIGRKQMMCEQCLTNRPPEEKRTPTNPNIALKTYQAKGTPKTNREWRKTASQGQVLGWARPQQNRPHSTRLSTQAQQ